MALTRTPGGRSYRPLTSPVYPIGTVFTQFITITNPLPPAFSIVDPKRICEVFDVNTVRLSVTSVGHIPLPSWPEEDPSRMNETRAVCGATGNICSSRHMMPIFRLTWSRMVFESNRLFAPLGDIALDICQCSTMDRWHRQQRSRPTISSSTYTVNRRMASTIEPPSSLNYLLFNLRSRVAQTLPQASPSSM